MHSHAVSEAAPAAPQVVLRRADPAALLAEPGTLAVLGFGAEAPHVADPRYLRVALQPGTAADFGVCEQWRVTAPVETGVTGACRWSCGGGWLFVALEASPQDDAARFTAEAYAQLADFMAARQPWRILRMWNFIAGINVGAGDAECYKRFCVGRGRDETRLFPDGYPAATAVGHHDPARPLQVYCLAAAQAGQRVENPRQLSAWRYPRQYGPVAPSFARAMRLPAGDALAISGTAAISGHASRHAGDLDMQLQETWENLASLLAAGGLPANFDAAASLHAYVRHAADMPRVAAFLDAHAPATPRLILEADICRRELLVEIDGWR